VRWTQNPRIERAVAITGTSICTGPISVRTALLPD
jgi:hypothetical protein